MPALTAVAERLDCAVERFDPRALSLALGRGLLAAAQLAMLATNPDAVLFPEDALCGGVRVASLWCLADRSGAGMLAARILTVAVLVLVLVGYRPRWTAIPHWYVTASLAASLPVANGGDRIAQLTTMLLIPLCLGDGRRWHWTPARSPLPPRWRGAAFAALLAVRAQLAVIYLYAALSKLADPMWRHGGAMALVWADPYFGLPRPVAPLFAPVLRSYWMIAAVSWSVVAVQLVLAAALLGSEWWRRAALGLGTVLHASIGILMGLPIFGLTMIALLLVACGPGADDRRVRRWGFSRSSHSTPPPRARMTSPATTG